MIKEENRIRIWKANSPLKEKAGELAVVGIYAEDDFLDELAINRPTDYLAELENLQNAMMNQIAYRKIEDGLYGLLCLDVADNGRAYVYNFLLALKDGEYVIRRYFKADICLSDGWKDMKKERRARGAK